MGIIGKIKELLERVIGKFKNIICSSLPTRPLTGFIIKRNKHPDHAHAIQQVFQ